MTLPRLSCCRNLAVAGVMALALVACDDDDEDVAGGTTPRNYEVTITNLTTGQPLSPGVIVTHREENDVFRLGGTASEGVRLIAEEGNPSTLAASLTGSNIGQVVVTDGPIHRQGGSGPTALTFRVRAEGEANRLSIVTMLGCTNDGFTGVSGMRLPDDSETIDAVAYDAGTELNNELSTHIPDGCNPLAPAPLPNDGGLRAPTSAPIGNHQGIAGVGDLTPAFDWQDPVARIRVRRVE
jgi:hypothetical protein